MTAPEKRISNPSRPSLSFGAGKVSPLQALALMALVECAQQGLDGPTFCMTWRRWLATNLTLIEYQRKGWKTQALADWWRRTVKELRAAGLVFPASLEVTDNGRACAFALRPQFQPPMPAGQLVSLNRQIYANKTGRFD